MRATLAIRDTPWLWSVVGAVLVGVATGLALGAGTRPACFPLRPRLWCSPCWSV